MNPWVYVGYGLIALISMLFITLVMIGIFICVDQYFEDKRSGKK